MKKATLCLVFTLLVFSLSAYTDFLGLWPFMRIHQADEILKSKFFIPEDDSETRAIYFGIWDGLPLKVELLLSDYGELVLWLYHYETKDFDTLRDEMFNYLVSFHQKQGDYRFSSEKRTFISLKDDLGIYLYGDLQNNLVVEYGEDF